jgi:glycosyltransferase involved in cell wall biosynthesis
MQVSVIIPTYNYGRFLQESVGSVQLQTVEDIEILVVDDGSTDDTQDVLGAICAKDERVRNLRIENSGVAHARNQGLEHASGEFIAYLDADDIWHAEKLEMQLELMLAEPEVGLVFTNAALFSEDGEFPDDRFTFMPELDSLATRAAGRGTGHVITEDTFPALLGFSVLAATPSSVLLRRSDVEELRWANPLETQQTRGDGRVIQVEDQCYMAQVYRRVTAGFLREPLVLKRRHGKNSYVSVFETLRPSIAALRFVLNDATDPLSSGERDVLRRRIGRAWCGVGYHHFWRRRPLGSAGAYFRALRYPGWRLNAALHLFATPIVLLLPSREAEDEDFV